MPLGAIQVKNEFKLDAGKTMTFSVSCDLSGGIAISGGYAFNGDIKLVSSQPAKNGWQVTLTNETKAQKAATVYANCLIGSGGKVQTTYVTKILDGKSATNIKLSCQKAGEIVGGGYDISKSPQLIVSESRMVGNEWVVSVANPSLEKLTLDAFAQCLSGRNLPPLVARNDEVKIPAGKKQTIELKCGTYTIGGGYQLPSGLALRVSQPTSAGWIIEVENKTQKQLVFKPQVICADSPIQKKSPGK